jgi:hypothetical protein
MKHGLTFRQVERNLGLKASFTTGDSPLEQWYANVLDKPIAEFTDSELCKACRQALHLEAVIPVAIDRMETEPLAGELYDGELIVALSGVAEDFWSTHPVLAERVRQVLTSGFDVDDEHVTTAMETMRNRLGYMPIKA